jgi:hypothetical protein
MTDAIFLFKDMYEAIFLVSVECSVNSLKMPMTSSVLWQ